MCAGKELRKIVAVLGGWNHRGCYSARGCLSEKNGRIPVFWAYLLFFLAVRGGLSIREGAKQPGKAIRIRPGEVAGPHLILILAGEYHFTRDFRIGRPRFTIQLSDKNTEIR